jgi:hydroxyacylglutathione hydrolase
MYFEQFYLGCLAHASYMFGGDGVAAVVDPQRDVEQYLYAAAEHGLKIAHIFETHLHADFVSGHRELAERTGAAIYIGAAAGAAFPHVPVSDGTSVKISRGEVRVLETPGHTPESVSLLLFDPERTNVGGTRPWAVLTGDTLFIGDVGRPDLSPGHTPRQLAALLYDSLHGKLLALPDEVLVYPAHGAGSLCGRNLRADRFSTIGTERLTNYALQIPSRGEFVAQMTANLPPRPQYFPLDAAINREGAPALAALTPMGPLSCAEVRQRQREGTVVLDTRAPADFAAAHVPGSVHISLAGQFASWAGTVLGLRTPLAVVADSERTAQESRMRLARVGIEQVAGYLGGGMEEWRDVGNAVSSMPQVTPAELRARSGGFTVLDVRREPEWNAGHIEGAHWHALDDFPRSLPALDRHAPIAVHCKSGYRSMIAASLLRRAGFADVTNIIGGYDAWAAGTEK